MKGKTTNDNPKKFLEIETHGNKIALRSVEFIARTRKNLRT